MFTFLKGLWKWSGFGQKTLWDFIQVFGILIPLFIFTEEQKREAEVRQDTHHQEVLSNYLDQMREFLLGEQLLQNSVLDGEVQAIARATTLSTLRQLDGGRKGEVLRFLHEADLIGQCKAVANCQTSIISLDGAQLDEIEFDFPIPLPGVDLAGASLAKANLANLDLNQAKMQRVNLQDSDLSGVLLTEANMESAFLDGINLSNAALGRVKLDGAYLSDANLEGVELSGASLRNAVLKNANLKNGDLSGANFRYADLRNADLTGANLEGVALDGAVYNDATKFPELFDLGKQRMKLCKLPLDQECRSPSNLIYPR